MMLQALTILDDVLDPKRAVQIRNQVIADGFRDVFYMQGKYEGTNMTVPLDEIFIQLANFFSAPLVPVLGAWRLGHKDTKLHVNIHADNPISRWAAVYYLNLPDQCKGGTAFYRHHATGWDSMPTQEQLDEAGLNLDDFKKSWSNPDDWKLISVAGMKFNRMIVYPTQLFHSRYPLDGWGDKDNPDECRLIGALFFDVNK